MKKISLVTVVALAVLIISAAAPAVSAEEIYNETYTVFQPGDYTRTFDTQLAGDSRVDSFVIYPPNTFDGVTIKTIIGQFDGAPSSSGSNSDSCVFKYNGEVIGTGECGYFYYTVSGAKWLQIWVAVDDGLELPSTSSKIRITIHPDNKPLTDVMPTLKAFKGSPSSGTPYAAFTSSLGNTVCYSASTQKSTITYMVDWKTNLVLNKHGSFTDVVVTSYGPNSNIEVRKASDDTLIYSKIGIVNDSTGVYNDFFPIITRVRPQTLDTSFIRTHSLDDPDDPDDPEDPDNTTLTVYVKNSQTGALIANSRIVIDALVDGEYYNVVNRTEPSGIFSITLQPTGGGQPNPDGYRLIATADGYNNPMPEINFTVDDYKLSLYCLLDPIAGGPVNENKTFIDFFVRDMSSNPISGATVKFGKYTLITNSQGYTVFEVDKNNNYSWTVSKSGYGPLTGNAVIGDAPRHTINTVLAPIVTPTTTTPIPTSPPISPTPTMTAPTGEHVSNWLEWFAAHFGMILGGGVEIGKIFMWLCFTVPVGVYVGKEAKAGAAGFMAGAGIVTLFFVLIGWVPIWLVVLLALIIGLLYAKVFNSQDNGGGR